MTPASGQAGERIAYVMSRFPKITETFVLYEILALIDQGVDVRIYPLIHQHESVRHPDVDRVMSRVTYLPVLSLAIIAANIAFLLRHPMRYLGTLVRSIVMNAPSANHLFGVVAMYPKVVHFARLMEKDGIDHVHAHFATHPAQAAFIVRALVGIPYSFTAHGSDIHVDQRGLREKILASAFAITVSDYNKRFMMDAAGNDLEPRIHVVRCGVDLQDFAPRGVEPADRLRILCVASLEPVKGHAVLIDACRVLQERKCPFVCRCVGKGPLRSEIERSIADAGLTGSFELLGAQPRPRVRELLAESDVVVLASVLDAAGRREGIPVALMEAMACGRAVVASDISGIPELIDDGTEGLLFPPGDPNEAAAALSRLAASPELRRELGAAARTKVETAYDLRRNAGSVAELIRSVK